MVIAKECLPQSPLIQIHPPTVVSSEQRRRWTQRGLVGMRLWHNWRYVTEVSCLGCCRVYHAWGEECSGTNVWARESMGARHRHQALNGLDSKDVCSRSTARQKSTNNVACSLVICLDVKPHCE